MKNLTMSNVSYRIVLQRAISILLTNLLQLRRYRRLNLDIKNLREMDDRMLADIGLRRLQIESAVRTGRTDYNA